MPVGLGAVHGAFEALVDVAAKIGPDCAFGRTGDAARDHVLELTDGATRTRRRF